MATRRALLAAVPPSLTHQHRRAKLWWGALLVAALIGLTFLGVLQLRAQPGDATAATHPLTAMSRVPTHRWESVAGVKLPVSVAYGPHDETDGRASGYGRRKEGAALAAAQVLMRTSATAGSAVFLPVLASQVAGANTAAFKASTLEQYEQLRNQSGVPDGEPIPNADARVAGYVVRSYSDTAATVEVVVDSPALRASARLISFVVSLSWSYGDWRVLAPPRGDWGSVATQLGAPPVGMLTYDQIG